MYPVSTLRITPNPNQSRRRSDSAQADEPSIVMRHPSSYDGSAINALIAQCSPLDRNSMYCNLLQCSDFSATCLLAECDGEILAWVSGYRLPKQPSTLFIWQVAVSDAARGKGLGKRLLLQLLQSDGCRGVTRLQTTITSDNEASKALFRAVADALNTSMKRDIRFESESHFDGEHASEYQFSLGPFNRFNASGDRTVSAA